MNLPLKSISGVILLLFSLNGIHTGPVTPGKADTSSQSLQDSMGTLLFKVSSEQSDKVSYLFGTHHAFGEAFFDTLSNVKEALNASTRLIEESLEIPGHTSQEIINRRQATTPWSKYMSKKDLAYIRDLFANSPTDYEKIKPSEMSAFLNRLYRTRVCQTKAEGDSSLSLDNHIAAVAKNQGMELTGLETRERQLEMIAKDVEGMPVKVHKKRLAKLIENLRTGTGDCADAALYASMNWDYRLSQPCGNTLILIDRNNAWMTTIETLIKEENCFIAVGLSHLMFECGLINQIKALGYTVTPIPVN